MKNEWEMKFEEWGLNALQSMQCLVMNAEMNFCMYCLDPHCGEKCWRACAGKFNNVIVPGEMRDLSYPPVRDDF